MKATFVRIEKNDDGTQQDVFFRFMVKRGKKDFPFLVSSYGMIKEKQDLLSIFFGDEKRVFWPEGAGAVTAEITLPGGSIRKTWTLRNSKAGIFSFDEMFRLPEKNGCPNFEVDLTFDPR